VGVGCFVRGGMGTDVVEGGDVGTGFEEGREGGFVVVTG
jgi:hypothetical protein